MDKLSYHYEFKPGVQLKCDPNIVGKFLNELRRQKGGFLTPKDVVDAARDPSSPIHHLFEWDDKVAAEQHRLNQARFILRAIVLVVENEPKPPVRAFVRVICGNRKPKKYTHIIDAMSDAKMRNQVLIDARKDLEEWKKRYINLIEFADIFKKIDEIIRELDALLV